eukprot:353778-Chlamydomonas_euryale.AAC.7
MAAHLDAGGTSSRRAVRAAAQNGRPCGTPSCHSAAASVGAPAPCPSSAAAAPLHRSAAASSGSSDARHTSARTGTMPLQPPPPQPPLPKPPVSGPAVPGRPSVHSGAAPPASTAGRPYAPSGVGRAAPRVRTTAEACGRPASPPRARPELTRWPSPPRAAAWLGNSVCGSLVCFTASRCSSTCESRLCSCSIGRTGAEDGWEGGREEEWGLG